jgi:hypothetical protein
MNAMNLQTAASALFACSANVARTLAGVNGAMKQVSQLKREWHSLHAWANDHLDATSTWIRALVVGGPIGILLPESLVAPVPVPCAVTPLRYRHADPVGLALGTGFRSAERRGFRQRPASQQ